MNKPSPAVEAWLEDNKPPKPPTETQIATAVRVVRDARQRQSKAAS